jgi:predicted acetyltransferase
MGHMTRLHLPDVALCESWRAAMLEFGDEPVHGSGYWHRPEGEQRDFTAEGCKKFVDQLLEYADHDRLLPDDRVHCDYYWIVDGEPGQSIEVVGFLAFRHELNAFLLEEGGHIGYAVRPGRRRQGHATRALGLAVRRAAEFGLDRVLVTCDDDNLASAAAIVGNGGVLEDVRKGKERYWITTGAGSATALP